MNVERRIEQLESLVKQLQTSFQISNNLVTLSNDPIKMKELFEALAKGADAMGEIRGKQEQMDKRIDDSQRWMQFHSRALMGIGIAIFGALVANVLALWKIAGELVVK